MQPQRARLLIEQPQRARLLIEQPQHARLLNNHSVLDYFGLALSSVMIYFYTKMVSVDGLDTAPFLNQHEKKVNCRMLLNSDNQPQMDLMMRIEIHTEGE